MPFEQILGKVKIYLKLEETGLWHLLFWSRLHARDTGKFHSGLFCPQFLGSHDFSSYWSFVTLTELGNCFESFQYKNHLWLQKDWGLGENCIIRAWHGPMALSPYQRAMCSQPALSGLYSYPNSSLGQSLSWCVITTAALSWILWQWSQSTPGCTSSANQQCRKENPLIY